MSFTSRRLRHWQFSVGVMAPAVLLLVLAAAAVTGFVLWSTSSIDQHEIEQHSALAAHAIERQIAEIPYAQQSVAIWDDAIIYSKLQFARDWLDNNVGVWMNEYYGYEATAIISDADRPIYAAVGSRSEAFDYFEARWEAIRPLVAQLRREIAGGALARYESGETTVYPSAVETKVVAGVPAVISVVPITSQTGAIAQPAGTEYLHVAIEYLDADFARTLSDNYHFENARFTLQPDAQAGFASLPVFGRDGRVTAIFEWQPNRPGWRLLTQTGPVLGLAFLAATVLVVVLVNRLWASNAALEAERIEARHQATHDPLTGLANRVQFDHQLARDLGERRLRVPVALLMLDLDRFKHVNDTLGHDAGDDLINAVGQRLRQLIGPADVLARLGGDEFAIIHPCREGEEGALRLANRIVDALAKPFDLSRGEAFIGVSIGLVIAGPEDREPREVMRKADIALYEAKGKGRGRAVLYEESMNERLQDRHMIEAELREALKRDDQLSIALQPLYSGPGGDIVGAEVLVRWDHPRFGQVSPARFVPIAENAGLIEALGEFVLRRACTFGAQFPGRRIAVNISPAQLRNPRFPERVFDILVESAMRPSDLELEITEGILLDNNSPGLEAITTFRRAGIRIALDDFGTGYSSLNYLKRYPVDCIKIDRSFVAQLVPQTSSAAIVQAMVTLAHALDIEVTAEGVETHEQMLLLKSMGCNLFQGFLFSPPAPEEAIAAKFRRAPERQHSGVARVA